MIAEEESAAAVRDAYDAGYKAGRIDGASIWEAEYKKLQAENKRLKEEKSILVLIAIACGAGLLVNKVVK